MTDKLQDVAEHFLFMRKRGGYDAEGKYIGFVYTESALRAFLAQYVLCSPEVMAYRNHQPGYDTLTHAQHGIKSTPLHAPAKEPVCQPR